MAKYVYVIREDLDNKAFTGFNKEADAINYCEEHKTHYAKMFVN